MKKLAFIVFSVLMSGLSYSFSQESNDTTFYLITCAPGTETYSIYGHSALRVVIPAQQSDITYNWGVFDFDTPNFAWKFAKGRLNYKLAEATFQQFLGIYMYENRSVYSQVINLSGKEKQVLLNLVKENLKPENVYYRYDFFYDDCSTRIRDLIEKAVGSKLQYPPEETKNVPSFRQKVGEYQSKYPWLKMGIDLIMGTPGEKKASFRERMFLPIDLQRNLTQAVINRDRKMVPLLQSSVGVLLFDPPADKLPFFLAPMFVLSLLFILIVFLSARFRKSKMMKYVDLLLFTVFSVLALLMIFFNFFTDHQQMKMNMNIIWFSPLVFICLFCLLFNKKGLIWFRIVFFLALVFVPVSFIMPGALNNSFLPVILILALRSSARAGFSWNPLDRNNDA
jgi:hypothetical protein